ncbi:NAD-dependent deacetylase [Gammaproteobacteria bacterium]
MIYQEAARVIKKARCLLICAGAGMGVDSGLPDFRGNDGFWMAYPLYAQKGLGFKDIANPLWFKKYPELAWGFYGHRLNLYTKTLPHAGFGILKEWAEAMPEGYFVFTSNVDGHFQKANFSKNHILECHGSIHHLQCIENCNNKIFEAKNIGVEIDESSMRATLPLPICSNCGAVARPNILMFGDNEWNHSLVKTQSTKYLRWLHSVKKGTLVIIECGAGTGIPTVRHQSQYIAKKLDGKIIRINTRESNIHYPHISIASGAMDALLAISEAFI